MVRLKSSAANHHVVDFADHGGRPAKMNWTAGRGKILIPLASICFYYVHPNFSLEDLDLQRFYHDIRDGDGDPLGFELFCIPGGSDADCAQHYVNELKARGDVFEMTGGNSGRFVQYAAEKEPHGKLPGLVPSYKHWICAYHGIICVYKAAKYDHDEGKTFDIIEFGPALTPEDYDPGELERRGPQEPSNRTRVAAAKKRKVEKYKDQGVWVWFTERRSGRWYDASLSATFGAEEMGWTSWPTENLIFSGGKRQEGSMFWARWHSSYRGSGI
ncbi:hypothetical protein FBEOM_13208 [Fusarium beomiforme]|uniref:Uncharacterized protein n=1 Tax=Fusarium beomiforme TaxID=44412 RepID=A0A9P5A791_9HYPO|nr:hypothetical protein FBEOM_13208 [Fusarium beomiforme]